MRKFAVIGACLIMLGACAEHDPILPGERTPIFNSDAFKMLDTSVPNLPDEISAPDTAECPYTQDSTNVIRSGNRKIFSGFPTTNAVASNQTPVCSNGYVYAGLTTGELVKVNPNNRKIMWIADIYRASNMTGGASILDIIAPIVIRGNAVYAGGLGDAFCRINATSGAIKWCDWIGVAVPLLYQTMWRLLLQQMIIYTQFAQVMAPYIGAHQWKNKSHLNIIIKLLPSVLSK